MEARSAATPKATLAVSNLPDWVDESFLYQLFLPTKSVVSVKMAKHRCAGGGKLAHIEFSSPETAEGCLRAYNGTMAPNVPLRLDLSWATETLPKGEVHSAFVGDLAVSVTDSDLLQAFQSRYVSVFEARVMRDVASGRTKGFGFVRFTDEAQCERAIREMHGFELHGRQLRLSVAAKKPRSNVVTERELFSPEVTQGDFDQTNTTLFVGGITAATSETDLTHAFSPFGQILYVRVPPNKGCGFVQFLYRSSAEVAMRTMNSQLLNGTPMRISWGKNSTKHKSGPTAAQQAASYYSQPAAQTQAYAGAYPGTYGGHYDAAAWAQYAAGYQYAAAQQTQATDAAGWGWPDAAQQSMAADAGAAAHSTSAAAGGPMSSFGMADPTVFDVAAANRKYMDAVGPMFRPMHVPHSGASLLSTAMV